MKYTNYEEVETSTDFISIFDQIELFQPNPRQFVFEKIAHNTIINKEKIIKEFLALYYSKKNERVNTCKFVLTSEEIYKFSVLLIRSIIRNYAHVELNWDFRESGSTIQERVIRCAF